MIRDQLFLSNISIIYIYQISNICTFIQVIILAVVFFFSGDTLLFLAAKRQPLRQQAPKEEAAEVV